MLRCGIRKFQRLCPSALQLKMYYCQNQISQKSTVVLLLYTDGNVSLNMSSGISIECHLYQVNVFKSKPNQKVVF